MNNKLNNKRQIGENGEMGNWQNGKLAKWETGEMGN
jgi:hypothetical protein